MRTSHLKTQFCIEFEDYLIKGSHSSTTEKIVVYRQQWPNKTNEIKSPLIEVTAVEVVLILVFLELFNQFREENQGIYIKKKSMNTSSFVLIMK
jgi:hypothetical protein